MPLKFRCKLGFEMEVYFFSLVLKSSSQRTNSCGMEKFSLSYNNLEYLYAAPKMSTSLQDADVEKQRFYYNMKKNSSAWGNRRRTYSFTKQMVL